MEPLSLSGLYQRYTHLRAQLDSGTISHRQFVDRVHELQAQDGAGRWWTIDPRTGRYLTYSANGWVEASPPGSQPDVAAASRERQAAEQSRTRGRQPAADQPEASSGRWGCLSSPLATGLMSFGAAGLWFLWTSIRAVGGPEALDLVTPLLIGGLPFLLRLFQKRLDKLLGPLYAAVGSVPRSFRVGAALALPVVMGLLASGGGVGAVQRATFISVISGYVLTRRPGGAV